MTKIFIGSDHGGFDVKNVLRKNFEKQNINFEDCGAAKKNMDDDYPIFAERVARSVTKNGGVGILICRNGAGMCIAANKIAGVRAAVCGSEKTAETVRAHNDANVICLGADDLDDKKMVKIVEKFLGTEFLGGRHARRVEEICKLENYKF